MCIWLNIQTISILNTCNWWKQNTHLSIPMNLLSFIILWHIEKIILIFFESPLYGHRIPIDKGQVFHINRSKGFCFDNNNPWVNKSSKIRSCLYICIPTSIKIFYFLLSSVSEHISLLHGIPWLHFVQHGPFNKTNKASRQLYKIPSYQLLSKYDILNQHCL